MLSIGLSVTGALVAPALSTRYEVGAGARMLDPITCYLCGAQCSSEQELYEVHMASHVEATGYSSQRLREEYRKRVLFLEERDGPHAISGAELRRTAGAYMWQLTHSFRNGCLNPTFDRDAKNGLERALGSCAICAMSFWLEQLCEFHLFTRPAATAGPEHVQPLASRSDCFPDIEEELGQTLRGKYRVEPRAVGMVDSYLSMSTYQERWPLIPQRELLATSVKHPYIDSRWLLDTKTLSGMLTDSNELRFTQDGLPPPVSACVSCASALSRTRPMLPPCALANDNLMLAMPNPLCGQKGDALSEATLMLLALARSVVLKEVAQPGKAAAAGEQHEVLKGNTVALPQADCRTLATTQLPAPLAVLQPFLQEHLAVVFCGPNAEDMSRYPKLQVNCDQYVQAARFLTAHNPEYTSLEVNADLAQDLFASAGIPKVIQDLITCIQVDECFATPKGAEVVPRLLSLPMLLPHEPNSRSACLYSTIGRCLRFAAPKAMDEEDGDEVGQSYFAAGVQPGTEDHSQFLEHFAAKIHDLMEDHEDSPRDDLGRFAELKTLAANVGQDAFLHSLRQALAQGPASTQAVLAVRTGEEPLKYWEPCFWIRQFPDLFPYGDGAYGLKRRTGMSFQHWARMMLLRTELSYNVSGPNLHMCPAAAADPAKKPCQLCAGGPERPKLRQPRWAASVTFRFVVYDTWRRTEILRKAKMHVKRNGFQQNLKLVAAASAEHIRNAMELLGQSGTLRSAATDPRVDPCLRKALQAGGCHNSEGLQHSITQKVSMFLVDSFGPNVWSVEDITHPQHHSQRRAKRGGVWARYMYVEKAARQKGGGFGHRQNWAGSGVSHHTHNVST